MIKVTERELSSEDSARIKCQWGLGECERQAVVVEQRETHTSMFFWYYCVEHRQRD